MNSLDKNAISVSEMLRAKTNQTVKQFAKKHGVSRNMVYECFRGNGSQRIRIEIAKEIGKSPSNIWANLDETKKIIDDLAFARSL